MYIRILCTGIHKHTCIYKSNLTIACVDGIAIRVAPDGIRVARTYLAVGPGVLPITITRPTAICNRAVVAGKARVALALASQATAAPVACVCMCARVGVCACVCVSLNHIYTSASSSSILPFTKNSEKVSKPNRSSEGVYVCVHSD